MIRERDLHDLGLKGSRWTIELSVARNIHRVQPEQISAKFKET